ncbi:MAG: MBL fold metallo-hydrolase, partial [Acidobacteriota bacterium]|nr:MBL fold metallo-hydrolase [Acidobacteriota bacterium]
MLKRISALFLSLFAFAVYAQQKPLQIHFMDVGQGDGAILISPGGEIVAFDLGEDLVHLGCTKPLSYLEQLGITHIDYLFISHYHQDHLGCVSDVLAQYPLKKASFDRGLSYASPHLTYFNAYKQAVGSLRTAGTAGQHIVLDAASASPVDIEIIALNGNG